MFYDKIKAWHKKQKRIFDVYGFDKEFVYESSDTDYLDIRYSVNDIELMGYAGINDINKKDIYRGHIVRLGIYIYYIDIFRSAYSLILKLNYMTDFLPICNLKKEEIAGIEIIGNIYENLELLEHGLDKKGESYY